MFRHLLLALTLVACGPVDLESPADVACADALADEGLDYHELADAECVGSVWDTARYACNATGCSEACGPNASCANWVPNGTGGCNFYCVLNTVPERW